MILAQSRQRGKGKKLKPVFFFPFRIPYLVTINLYNEVMLTTTICLIAVSLEPSDPLDTLTKLIGKLITVIK